MRSRVWGLEFSVWGYLEASGWRWSTWRFMGSYKWGYISRVTIVMTHIRGLITPLVTTHEPLSRRLPQKEVEAKNTKTFAP